MSRPQVYGTINGGSETVVACVQVDTSGACEAELTLTQSAGGLWTLPVECHGCGKRFHAPSANGYQDAYTAEMVRIAADQIDNYDGPTDEEQAAMYESSLPTVAERQASAMRLK